MGTSVYTNSIFKTMTRTVVLLLTLLLGIILPGTNLFHYNLPSVIPTAKANNTAHALTTVAPFSQDWTNTGLITVNDNWAGVSSIQGFRGDDLTIQTGTDPQTLLADGSSTPLNVIANQSNPNTLTTGGVAEFDGIANPVIALQGSGTADAPHIVVYLDTTICASPSRVSIAYNVRDIDGSTDNAIQQVALHYRIGGAGNYINVAAGYISDATTGPSLATLVTPISLILPSAVSGQSSVELRIMTSNAVGNDEWVGIDDINVQCLPPTASNSTIVGRVTTASGNGIAKSTLSLTGPGLNQPRYALTTPFGYFSFSDVPAGENYVVTVQAKGFLFNQPSMLLNISDAVNEINFVALP